MNTLFLLPMLMIAGNAMSLACLRWYDLDEVRWATDALWTETSRHMRLEGIRDVPEKLDRSAGYRRQWMSPDFLFGQSCGYDVYISHRQWLRVVATPRYCAPGCEGSNYRSLIIVRQDAMFGRLEDLRGTHCVINTPTSHSGMNVLRALVAPLHSDGRFFSRVDVSGSHETSLKMVANGKVDVAAVDCVTHALLSRYRPEELARTRILCQTQAVPAPPYVTAATANAATVAKLRSALFRALGEPSLRPALDALLLKDVEVLAEDAYHSIQQLKELADKHDYREINCGLLASNVV